MPVDQVIVGRDNSASGKQPDAVALHNERNRRRGEANARLSRQRRQQARKRDSLDESFAGRQLPFSRKRHLAPVHDSRKGQLQVAAAGEHPLLLSCPAQGLNDVAKLHSRRGEFLRKTQRPDVERSRCGHLSARNLGTRSLRLEDGSGELQRYGNPGYRKAVDLQRRRRDAPFAASFASLEASGEREVERSRRLHPGRQSGKQNGRVQLLSRQGEGSFRRRSGDDGPLSFKRSSADFGGKALDRHTRRRARKGQLRLLRGETGCRRLAGFQGGRDGRLLQRPRQGYGSVDLSRNRQGDPAAQGQRSQIGSRQLQGELHFGFSSRDAGKRYRSASLDDALAAPDLERPDRDGLLFLSQREDHILQVRQGIGRNFDRQRRILSRNSDALRNHGKFERGHGGHASEGVALRGDLLRFRGHRNFRFGQRPGGFHGDVGRSLDAVGRKFRKEGRRESGTYRSAGAQIERRRAEDVSDLSAAREVRSPPSALQGFQCEIFSVPHKRNAGFLNRLARHHDPVRPDRSRHQRRSRRSRKMQIAVERALERQVLAGQKRLDRFGVQGTARHRHIDFGFRGADPERPFRRHRRAFEHSLAGDRRGPVLCKTDIHDDVADLLSERPKLRRLDIDRASGSLRRSLNGNGDPLDRSGHGGRRGKRLCDLRGGDRASAQIQREGRRAFAECHFAVSVYRDAQRANLHSVHGKRHLRIAPAARGLLDRVSGESRAAIVNRSGKNGIVPGPPGFDASGKTPLEIFGVHAGPETRERRDIQVTELSLQTESGEDRPGSLERSRSQAGLQRLQGNGAILPGHRDPGTDGERNIPNLQRAIQRHVPFADRNRHVLQRGRKMLRRHADVPEPDRSDRDRTGSAAASEFRQDRKQPVAVDPSSFKGDRIYRHFSRQKRHQSRTDRQPRRRRKRRSLHLQGDRFEDVPLEGISANVSNFQVHSDRRSGAGDGSLANRIPAEVHASGDERRPDKSKRREQRVKPASSNAHAPAPPFRCRSSSRRRSTPRATRAVRPVRVALHRSLPAENASSTSFTPPGFRTDIGDSMP